MGAGVGVVVVAILATHLAVYQCTSKPTMAHLISFLSSKALCDRLPLGHRHVGAEYEGVRLVHEASEARAALCMGRLGV